MSRTRVRIRRRRLALVAAVSVLGGVWVGPLSHPSAGRVELRPAAAHRYVVRDGDTIWSIAGRVARGADPRPVVDAIQAANHVDPGRLVPGQTLQIPTV